MRPILAVMGVAACVAVVCFVLALLSYMQQPKPALTVDSCINWMSIQARELGQPTDGIQPRCKELVEKPL